MTTLSGPEITRIAAEAVVDTRTVRRMLAGATVSDSSRLRIAQAMARLGLTNGSGRRKRTNKGGTR